MSMSYYQLHFFVPSYALEAVKCAIFSAGGGTLGAYTHCCWQTQGSGQFMPNTGANPAIGSVGMLTQVDEWYVLVLCAESSLQSAILALKAAHPYEEPAYGVTRILMEADL